MNSVRMNCVQVNATQNRKYTEEIGQGKEEVKEEIREAVKKMKMKKATGLVEFR